MIESSSKHSHSHSYSHPNVSTRNPFAHVSPTDRLERLFMFLEAQFGSEALTPIETPRVRPDLIAFTTVENQTYMKSSVNDSDSDEISHPEGDIQDLEKIELGRLHKLGIPVPGIEIKVDKMVARVWLEDLEVECGNRIFGDRVRVVVERAVEAVASLWV